MFDYRAAYMVYYFILIIYKTPRFLLVGGILLALVPVLNLSFWSRFNSRTCERHPFRDPNPIDPPFCSFHFHKHSCCTGSTLEALV